MEDGMRTRTWIPLLLGAGAFAGAALLWQRADSGPAARATTTPTAAQTVRVLRRDVGTSVRATGVLKPRTGAEVRVGSQISGVVKRLYVRIGDTVRAGEPLAALDDRDLVARRAETVAAEGVARADLRLAEADQRRKRELARQRLIAPSELDAAERAAERAAAQVAQAAAALASANTQLGYARIAAPIDGVVSSVSTQEGETVAAAFAAPTFVTLLDLSRLEVRAYVDETDIGRVAVGQGARFTVDTYGDDEFEGRVEAIYPQAEIRDNVVDYVTVLGFTPVAGKTLRPEMTATVRIALDVRKDVLAVPVGALRHDGGETFVLRIGAAEPEHRTVAVGTRDASYVEIVSGLAEGDSVLVGDLQPQNGDSR
jgi:macrolide-specific efflux system membrane fusion protein